VLKPESRELIDASPTDGIGIESAELYMRLVEANPDPVFLLRIKPEVRMEYMNAASERMLGHPRARMRSADLKFILSWYAESEWDSVKDVAESRRFFPVAVRRMRRADGSLFWAEIHSVPIRDETAAVIAQLGTIRDVSDREDVLVKLRVITEALPELLFQMDDSGAFVEQIPTASRQPARLFLGKRLEEIVPEGSRSDAGKQLREALTGTPSSFRCEITVFDEERTYEFRLLPCGSGEMLAFLRDVTDEVWVAGETERRAARAELEGTVERQLGMKNPYEFTFREFTVLHLLAKGAADKEMARELGVVPSTVHKHVSNILGKMGASSRTSAGVRAVREGLVPT
jgi:PAS domain S-box-containing protein